ncbi:cell division protein FtsX [Oxobacter pfennigii]|uniref:Cell division protein FtsX n=1 Tax=Oxobacter pfennigii TaxID=36849 RepID=A0A0P8YUN7_9CLOT|nr:permease-like cell division protein FtsX [Oxobacter pfennigii]KPU43411.1 cell division protein FtsX [Oxobacter pfennigii]
MKINTVKYYFKEGIQSIMRNKMMSIASISTVMASLLIFGVFFITLYNVNSVVKDVEGSVEIKVFLKDDITDEQKSDIESRLKLSEGVKEVEFESKRQALENFKEQLGEKADLVADIDPEEVMPNSYIIKMYGPQYVDGVVETLNSMSGIDKINDARSIMDRLIQITSFIKVLGLSLMGILLIVAVFLISNTIKLTVMARRREIGIMKYIGATDWFIRWPFIIEGVFLGTFGALFSAIILGYGYFVAVDATISRFAIIQLVDPFEIVPYLAVMFISVGVVLGSIGSIISLRRFLKV